jgi:hypothetical protein
MHPSPWRLLRMGWIRLTDLDELTLDEVDLMNLYLDALDEAMMASSKGADP